MKRFFAFFGFILLSLSTLLGTRPVAFAAGERLEVHIHKNTLDGEQWTSTAQPIRVNIAYTAGNEMGIGVSGPEYPVGSGTFLLDPAKGPLKADAPQNCSFSWNDAEGNPVNKSVTVPRYLQRAPHEFVIPPLRIADERIATDAVTLANCGGDESAYQNLLQELSSLPLNPFRAYREYITLPLEETLLGREISVSIAANPATSGLTADDVAPDDTDKIRGYACHVTNPDGSKAEGICQKTLRLDPALAENGVFRVDLVVVENHNEVAASPEITEPLVQGINAEFSAPVTFVGSFLLRTTSLLDWALAIDETGLRNENITSIYQKSLTIVNGLFIVSLLAIALLWNFSIVVSRERLKRVGVLFVVAAISVNFALPVTRLFVDGANLLQKTLLIKEIPAVQEGIGITGGNGNTSTQSENQHISANDIFSAYDLDAGGFVGLQKTAYLDKNYPEEVGTPVDTSKLNAKSDLYVERFGEQTWTTVVLAFLGGFGQLLIALILLFRYIILWFLLIFSPFLLVLAIFDTTRPLFRSWLWLYGRWLIIGPILALSLFIIVSIWGSSGIPLESAYTAPSSLVFPNTTNLYLSAPGIDSGYLSTPREIMKYIAALMMLYLAVILPFWLTRQIPGAAEHFGNKFAKLGKIFSALRGNSETTNNSTQKEKEVSVEKNQELSILGKSLETSTLGSANPEQGNAGTQTLSDTSPDISKGGKNEKNMANLSTKDLVERLQIIASTESFAPASAEKNARTGTEKDHLLSELSVRAQKGDAVAQTALEKVMTTNTATSFKSETTKKESIVQSETKTNTTNTASEKTSAREGAKTSSEKTKSIQTLSKEKNEKQSVLENQKNETTTIEKIRERKNEENTPPQKTDAPTNRAKPMATKSKNIALTQPEELLELETKKPENEEANENEKRHKALEDISVKPENRES